MLVDKIAKELYEAYCDESETLSQKSSDYKDANELVSYAMEELREILPEDKRKLYLELESYINHRDAVSGRDTYKYAFNQGAKFILELLSDK
jgi:hypothetical protein